MILAIVGIAVAAALSLATIGQSDHKAYLAEWGRDYCEKMGWQFLDETVALKSIRIRHSQGRWSLVRCYAFEYSPDGIQRLKGEMITKRPWQDPLIRTVDPKARNAPPHPQDVDQKTFLH